MYMKEYFLYHTHSPETLTHRSDPNSRTPEMGLTLTKTFAADWNVQQAILEELICQLNYPGTSGTPQVRS